MEAWIALDGTEAQRQYHLLILPLIHKKMI
jgi:hypothetical protein